MTRAEAILTRRDSTLLTDPGVYYPLQELHGVGHDLYTAVAPALLYRSLAFEDRGNSTQSPLTRDSFGEENAIVKILFIYLFLLIFVQ